MKYYLKRNSHRILKAVLALAFIALALFGLKYFLDHRGVIVSTADSEEASTSSEAVALESRVLNFGSVRWGDDVRSSETSFQNLSAFSRTDYDAWIANLDCQIEVGKGCKDVLADDFKSWFNVVGVGDIGNDATKSNVTSKTLIESNVQFFGKLASAEKSEACGVIALPARYRLKNTSYRQATMPIVLCGVNAAQTLNVDLEAHIKEASQVLPVWVYSLDDTGASSQDVQKIYRSYIDAGADLVLGVSKESLGTTESYKNKLIAYSLGSFMGPTSLESSPTSVLVGISISAENNPNIERWEEISKTCSGYSDLCLEAGKSQGLVRPEYHYGYSIQGVSRIDSYNPVPTDSMQSSEVARIIDWVKTSSILEPATQSEPGI